MFWLDSSSDEDISDSDNVEESRVVERSAAGRDKSKKTKFSDQRANSIRRAHHKLERRAAALNDEYQSFQRFRAKKRHNLCDEMMSSQEGHSHHSFRVGITDEATRARVPTGPTDEGVQPTRPVSLDSNFKESLQRHLQQMRRQWEKEFGTLHWRPWRGP